MAHLTIAAYLLAFASPGLALPEVTQDYWIILTGSKEQRQTEKLLAALMKRWPARVELRSGYPKVEKSDGKKGLNPGFFIALAGACTKREDAMAVQNVLRKTFPGVYVRGVTRYLPGVIPECPRLAIDSAAPRAKPKVPKRYTLEAEGPAAKNGLQWKIYVAKRRCGSDVIVQLLDAKGALVDERREDAHCVQGDPTVGDLGESKVWRAYLEHEKDSPITYVMFTYEQWASDTGCNGGVALCPTPDGIAEETLDGVCNCSSYEPRENETHCQ